MDIGQITEGSEVTEVMYRGSNLEAEYELWEDGSAAGSCAAPVLGDPTSFPTGTGLFATGRVTGTGEEITVTTSLVAQGSATTPARVRVSIAPFYGQRAFAEGALRALTFHIQSASGGVFTTQIRARVSVVDTSTQ